jgi:hypothetical protein
MFRSIGDFVKTWEHESASTLKLLQQLTDVSLAQAVAAEDRAEARWPRGEGAVPGVYGPARHEWGTMGMEAPPI